MSDKVILKKPRSPHEVRISPDQSDAHFSVVELRKVKTGQLVTSHYILTADAAQWIGMYEKDGFEIDEQINE